MTDDEIAHARHKMLTNVPAQGDIPPQGQSMSPVSFSMGNVNANEVTIRFADGGGRFLDLRLNNVVAIALGHCLTEVQRFAAEPDRRKDTAGLKAQS